MRAALGGTFEMKILTIPKHENYPLLSICCFFIFSRTIVESTSTTIKQKTHICLDSFGQIVVCCKTFRPSNSTSILYCGPTVRTNLFVAIWIVREFLPQGMK